MTRIAIVGGGLGGLATARTLVAAGVDAYVLESHSHAGGVIGTTEVDGFTREHAASSFLGGPARGAVALCNELGVAVDKASPRAKKRWIFLDGKLRALPSNPIELVRSDLLTWRGKLDLLREPFNPPGPVGQDESVHDFAARRLGAEAARAIVSPFVTGVYAADAHDISIEAGFPKLAALAKHGSIVRGLARNAARGAAGSLLRKIAGKHKSKATPRGMYAPRGGLGSMIEALAAELGSRVRLGTLVDKIEPSSKGVLIDGEQWDGAVIAVPAEDAPSIVAIPELSKRLSAFHRAPAALVYLGFPAAAVAQAADGFGALVALGENVRVLGIVFESTVWEGRAPEGQVLLRCIFGGGRDPSATELDDGALIAQAIRDVGIVLGASGTPTHTSVIRWQRGVAQYGLGHRDRVRAAVTAARTHKIALAGADYYGPGVNDICIDTARILDEVRAW